MTIKYAIGSVLESNKYGKFEILGRVKRSTNTRFVIKFLNTGNIIERDASDCIRGRVIDNLVPSIYGVGYTSDLTTPKSYNVDGVKKNTPSYEVWLGILRRCYSEESKSYRDYGGKGVVVCEEWLDFTKFDKWFNENYIDGYHIDKDILSENYCGKVYNPEYCRFIPVKVNSFMTNSRRARGLYPVGVYRKVNKSGTIRYIAQVGDLVDRQSYLGRFHTMHEAFLAYKNARESLAKQLAVKEYGKGNIPLEIYERLMSWVAYPYP